MSADNRRDPVEVAAEAEALACWLNELEDNFLNDNSTQQRLGRAAAFIREAYTEPHPAPCVYFVGVKDGAPIVRKVSDATGDCTSVEIYPNAEDALARFHNVRRVVVSIDDEPVRAPENWGAIDGN